jgi:hypothetical protein
MNIRLISHIVTTARMSTIEAIQRSIRVRLTIPSSDILTYWQLPSLFRRNNYPNVTAFRYTSQCALFQSLERVAKSAIFLLESIEWNIKQY